MDFMATDVRKHVAIVLIWRNVTTWLGRVWVDVNRVTREITACRVQTSSFDEDRNSNIWRRSKFSTYIGSIKHLLKYHCHIARTQTCKLDSFDWNVDQKAKDQSIFDTCNCPVCHPTACSTGYYGDNCNMNCGNCFNDETCHFINGSCLSGCRIGYQPPFCAKGNIII